MRTRPPVGAALLAALCLGAGAARAANVTFSPYIQSGDNGPFGPTDQMVVAWQTDETAPNQAGGYTVLYGKSLLLGSSAAATGRVVDNYLSADPTLAALSIPTAYGAHTDYSAVLRGLDYDTTYYYTVTGPGLAAGGFSGSFHTRRQGPQFSFEVQGDEGYYPGDPSSNNTRIVNYEARIIHEMYHVSDYSALLAGYGVPKLPSPDLALNTGDNVYTTACDSNYRDFWFGNWNSDTDNNNDGAPFIRSIPLYIVDGNHDVGSTGATANLLADSGPTVPGQFGPGRFGGGVGGGDAMAHFNNFYFPLNGPAGTDIQNVFDGDTSTPTGFYFQYNGVSYNSPAAVEALRASTAVDGGQGVKRQIDHESNYSFDYGNTHFVFLDANPHLFNGLLPPGPPNAAPAFPFPAYPSPLRTWLINDLDASKQTWKIVVYHQPGFSSGNATVSNDQMRRVAKFLEDHGVNMVFNGHEHNYQRTLPLRALGGEGTTPTEAGPPAVAADTRFDGRTQTVPDGVLYFVEGAGGNRDFDNDINQPRGSSLGIDQDDSATGTYTFPAGSGAAAGVTFPVGPASWLDTHLTDSAMGLYVPNAGAGPRITRVFKSKVFSFADVVVNGSTLSLYQISEPLTATPSTRLGTDASGQFLNAPLPDTVVDPTTGDNVQLAGDGTPALLDQITVTKPDVSGTLRVTLSAPPAAVAGGPLVYTVLVTNGSAYALNGAQAVVSLPTGVGLAGTLGDTLTMRGRDVVSTLGRIEPGARRVVQVKGRVAPGTKPGTVLIGGVTVRSGTALPVTTGTVLTTVVTVPAPAAP